MVSLYHRLTSLALPLLYLFSGAGFSQEQPPSADIGCWVSLVRRTDGSPQGSIPDRVHVTSRARKEEWVAMPKVWFRFWRMTEAGELEPRRVSDLSLILLKAETGGEGFVRSPVFELSNIVIGYGEPGCSETCFGLVSEKYSGGSMDLLVGGRKYKLRFSGCRTPVEIGFPTLQDRGEVLQCNFVFYGNRAPLLTGKMGPGSTKEPRQFMFVHCPFTPVPGNGRIPFSWARYYSQQTENGECWISDARFRENVAFEFGPAISGGTLLIGTSFGRTPRYVIRDVSGTNISIPQDATVAYEPEDAVKTVFQVPASLGDLTQLRWVKLKLDPRDAFAVNEFSPELAEECKGQLMAAERKLEWMCWPGRYRMEVEIDPVEPREGQPYAWDLGWIDIPRAPATDPILLPEGKVIRTISAEELRQLRAKTKPASEVQQ